MLFYVGTKARNRERIKAIRDNAPTAVEALARMFTDETIVDDGTTHGRLRAILAATENRFIPGLHNGLAIGLSGFRKEYEDPWETSTDQVGHFLTAVRLTVDPGFLSFFAFPLLLGAQGDDDVPLRLIIGHEKAPDPPSLSRLSPRALLTALRCLRAQYKSATGADIANFRAGRVDTIQVGVGVGNSMADLRLSYTGWLFGQWLTAGRFSTNEEVADWVRAELGEL